MGSKTWFLPPDFTFLPDGQISLGSIIASPYRPTATLASLASGQHPTIVLPEIRTVMEKNHSFSAERARSSGVSLIARIADLAGASAQADAAWSKSRTFGAADHEVRIYNGLFTPATLRAILDIDAVRQHVTRRGRWGQRRYIYVITGLRLARDGFAVTDESGRSAGSSLGASVLVSSDVPVEVSAEASVRREETRSSGYETAPGVVFA